MGAGAAYSDDRLADQVKVLEKVVQVAYDQDVRLALLAGDVFHRPRPTPATLLAFRWFTDAMAALEIPTIAILGNAGHDQEGVDRPCALDLFESRWFRVSRRPEYITEFANVVVVTLPSVPVSRLVAQSDSTARAPIFDQAAEALLAIATELRDAHGHMRVNAEDVGKHVPFILLGHWSVSGASLPNGLPVDSLAEPILDLASLERLNYDAMVFGHIHKPQPLIASGENAGAAFYCGSPMNVDFGEPHEHGCWIIDTEARTEFVPLKDRPFVTLEYDLDSPVDMQLLAPDGEVIAWGVEGIQDAVVRVKVKATEEQYRRVNVTTFKRRLLAAGASKVYQITADIVKQDRARVQGVDENLEPAAALDAWIDANEVVDGEGLRELLARFTAAT